MPMMHSPAIVIDGPLVTSPAPSPAISLPGQEPPPPPPTNGGFDEGDIILRSSDTIEFKVWRLILRLTSSVFSDMFAVAILEDPIDLTDDA
ncbi:hypothetical protein FRC08_014457 [Ceratobasidium sp. 394]|nr:hypothetical protein FRC08_014457 [Ceratobasidium sp. 394]